MDRVEIVGIAISCIADHIPCRYKNSIYMNGTPRHDYMIVWRNI
jgi:hypothetical protein